MVQHNYMVFDIRREAFINVKYHFKSQWFPSETNSNPLPKNEKEHMKPLIIGLLCATHDCDLQQYIVQALLEISKKLLIIGILYCLIS